MTITYELDLNTFEAWSGAVNTLDRIREEGKCSLFEAILEDAYPEGMTETELNDLLWFDSEWCYEMCGIRTESQIREELEEAEEELESLKEEFEEEAEELREEFDNAEEAEKAVNNRWEKAYANAAKEWEEKIEELREELENI